MDTPTPPPARTVAEQMQADADLVLAHVTGDAAGDFAMHTKTKRNARFAIPVAISPFARPDDLAVVLGWVMAALDGEAVKGRTLTANEVLVVAASRRLLDVLDMLHDLRHFCEAMAADDAREARRLWDVMQPRQMLLVALRPDLATLELLLHNLEAAQQPRRTVTH